MKEDNWEPKNGDWVYIKSLDFNVENNRLGEVKQISKFWVTSGRWDIIFTNGSNGYGCFIKTECDNLDSCLRPALPNEIPIEFRPKLSKEQKNNILKLIKEI